METTHEISHFIPFPSAPGPPSCNFIWSKCGCLPLPQLHHRRVNGQPGLQTFCAGLQRGGCPNLTPQLVTKALVAAEGVLWLCLSLPPLHLQCSEDGLKRTSGLELSCSVTGAWWAERGSSVVVLRKTIKGQNNHPGTSWFVKWAFLRFSLPVFGI